MVLLNILTSHCKTFQPFSTTTFQKQVFKSITINHKIAPMHDKMSMNTGTNEHQAIYGTGFEEKYKTNRPPVIKSLDDLTIYDPRRQNAKPRIIHFGADFNSHTTTPSTTFPSTVSISSLAPAYSSLDSQFYSSTPYSTSPSPIYQSTTTPSYSSSPSPNYDSTPYSSSYAPPHSSSTTPGN